MLDESDIKIAILGLGYVGLPLAIEFSKFYEVVGFDLNPAKVEQLERNIDSSGEMSGKELLMAETLRFTSNIRDLASANFYIVCVPTPIDDKNDPDLAPIRKATKSIAQWLKKGDVVVFESTVYPGLTEEFCVPILELESGLAFNVDFFCGYSPERINPGDSEHKLPSVVKITSGSSRESAIFIDAVYRKIIKAGTYLAPSIKVAEAAKVIENTQRDLNIALVNELAIIFEKLNINTEEVLKAASTKWNFLPFSPGLVGGHCIGVDPYYLTSKARSSGYNPEIILAGRALNDGMGAHIANVLLEKIENTNVTLEPPKVLIMGFTFKENCSDFRNTRVVSLASELEMKNCLVDIYDPYIDLVGPHHGVTNFVSIQSMANDYDAIIIAVAHREFKEMGILKIRSFGQPRAVIYDLKWIFDAEDTELRL